MVQLMNKGTEVGKQFFYPDWVLWFDKMQLLAIFGFNHFPFQNVIVFQLPIGRVMSVYENCLVVKIIFVQVLGVF